MPTTPPHPCYHVGCRALVASGPYCAAHARARQPARQHAQQASKAARQADDPNLALAARIRSGTAWQQARRVFIAQHPLCCDPFTVHQITGPRLSQHVHHIAPLIERPELACVESNLAALCTACHSHVESLVRKGKPTAYLFRFLPDSVTNVLESGTRGAV